jgi:catechol 2,3-dioxygenase
MSSTVTPRLARLGHVALRTPDLASSTAFFSQVIGLEVAEANERFAYLRAWEDHEHHTLVLCASEESGVDHVGWRAASPEAVDGFTEQLSADGVDVREVPVGTEQGQGRAIRFDTPSGFTYEIYYDVEKVPPGASRLRTNTAKAWARGISPRRIDHVNLSTRDVKTEAGWSEQSLGFHCREYVNLGGGKLGASWLGVSALAHDLAITSEVGERQRGLHHVAYFVDSASDVLRAADILSEEGLMADHGPGRHAISQAVCLYVRDPASGHRVEIYSGAYLVLDPDWEPIEWSGNEYSQWWGPEVDRTSAALPMGGTTPW